MYAPKYKFAQRLSGGFLVLFFAFCAP